MPWDTRVLAVYVPLVLLAATVGGGNPAPSGSEWERAITAAARDQLAAIIAIPRAPALILQ